MDDDDRAVIEALLQGAVGMRPKFRLVGDDRGWHGVRVVRRCSRLGWWWRVTFYEAMFTICRWPFFRWIVKLEQKRRGP